MSKVLEEVLAANEAYANVYGSKSELSLPPGNLMLSTCMLSHDVDV